MIPLLPLGDSAHTNLILSWHQSKIPSFSMPSSASFSTYKNITWWFHNMETLSLLVFFIISIWWRETTVTAMTLMWRHCYELITQVYVSLYRWETVFGALPFLRYQVGISPVILKTICTISLFNLKDWVSQWVFLVDQDDRRVIYQRSNFNAILK